MIRNRVLWGVFAVVVCISFVGAFSKTGGCEKADQGGVAVMFGQPVSQRDFNLARYFAIGMRDIPNLTPEREKAVRDMVWRRIAALRMAGKFGLTVSDSELATQITSDSGFQANGSFSRDRYQAFLQSQRITPQIFEQYLREELTLRKLASLMQAAVWAPASEVAQRARNFADKLTIQVADLPESIATTPEIGASHVEAFYEANSNLFMVPAMARVCYVAFDATPAPTGSAEIAEQDIEDYYVDHQGDYTITDTNLMTTKVLPLEEVRGGIVESMLREKSFDAARRLAADFSEKLLPDREGRTVSFLDLAARTGMAVHTTGFFSASVDLDEIQGCPSFKTEAFSLVPGDTERSVSDPVTGSNGVYVISAIEKMEAHVPALSNIVATVAPMAASNEFRKAYMAAADVIRADIQSDIAGGRTFAESLGAHSLNVSTTLTFSAYEAGPDEIPDFQSIAPAVIQLEQGSVSDVVRTEKGAAIVWVKKREPGEAIVTQMLKPRIAESLDGTRAGILFSDWSRYALNILGKFKETVQPAATPAPEEDEAAPERRPLLPPALDENLG
jgi:peptidyl-prolyl cis-trans isomerase D